MNEIEELKKEILKLEFQNKKDISEANKRMERIEKMQAQTQIQIDGIGKQLNHIGKHLNHITKLTGIAFENFASIDTTFDKVSKATARKK